MLMYRTTAPLLLHNSKLETQAAKGTLCVGEKKKNNSRNFEISGRAVTGTVYNSLTYVFCRATTDLYSVLLSPASVSFRSSLRAPMSTCWQVPNGE